MAVVTAWKQQRNVLFIGFLSLLAMIHLVVVNHDGVIGRKFYDFVTVSSNNHHHANAIGDDDDETLRNHNTVEFVSACLFLDESENVVSSFDFGEWLAYHFHVLPLRYLIVAMNQTTTTTRAIRDVLDKYRSYYASEMTILEWSDEDFMTSPVVHRLVKPYIPSYQERQGTFHYRCAQALQHYHRHVAHSKSGWMWLANNVYEYLVVHPNDSLGFVQTQPPPLQKFTVQEPGVVLRSLQLWQQQQETVPSPASTRACLQIETWDAVKKDPEEQDVYQQLPSMRLLNTSAFRTWRFQHGSRQARTTMSHPRVLDVTRIPTEDIAPHDRHPYPIPPNQNHTRCQNVGFVAVMEDHDNQQPKEQQQQNSTAQKLAPTKINAKDEIHVDLRPWAVGFVQNAGQSAAMDLLADFKKTKTDKSNVRQARPSQDLEERCAMLFFGLPRSYDTMVLPSITKNILIPNARHNCDVYVHYYYMTAEPAGRKNKGGAIDPTAVLKLADAVRMVARNYPANEKNKKGGRRRRRVPHVAFTHDTDDAFWHLRNRTVQKYRKTKDAKGNYLYFPFKAVSYEYPSSLDNIVKQWHSIESVWNLMERSMRQGVANYTRVALFRNDVMFVTPIDIYRTSFDDPEDDVDGRFAVIPPFCLYPVNDRMVYGSYQATKIWATKRFEYIEDHVRNHPWGPGYGMHSEMFLERSIFVGMYRETGVNVTMNPDICFFRTRADNTAMISDCDQKGMTRGIENMQKVEVVKEITGFTNCTRYSMGHPFEGMTCT